MEILLGLESLDPIRILFYHLHIWVPLRSLKCWMKTFQLTHRIAGPLTSFKSFRATKIRYVWQLLFRFRHRSSGLTCLQGPCHLFHVMHFFGHRIRTRSQLLLCGFQIDTAASASSHRLTWPTCGYCRLLSSSMAWLEPASPRGWAFGLPQNLLKGAGNHLEVQKY